MDDMSQSNFQFLYGKVLANAVSRILGEVIQHTVQIQHTVGQRKMEQMQKNPVV